MAIVIIIVVVRVIVRVIVIVIVIVEVIINNRIVSVLRIGKAIVIIVMVVIVVVIVIGQVIVMGSNSNRNIINNGNSNGNSSSTRHSICDGNSNLTANARPPRQRLSAEAISLKILSQFCEAATSRHACSEQISTRSSEHQSLFAKLTNSCMLHSLKCSILQSLAPPTFRNPEPKVPTRPVPQALPSFLVACRFKVPQTRQRMKVWEAPSPPNPLPQTPPGSPDRLPPRMSSFLLGTWND